MENLDLLRKYLEGELSDDEEQQALHIIADDPRLRKMLRYERTLYTSLSTMMEYDLFEVHDGFQY